MRIAARSATGSGRTLSVRNAGWRWATNESYRTIALTRGRMPPDRVFVVRNGPDLERVRIAAADPSLKHGKRFLIGYVGVIARQEGLDTLLEVARTIVHDMGRTDVHFTVVGSGPELPDLRTRTDELGIAAHLNFTGRVSDQQLFAILNTADVCVDPDGCNALNDKSTMIKIMEYMALAKPIVQFDLTEGRVSAGAASLYARNDDAADFANKIIMLLDDEELRLRMGQFGRTRVERELAWPHQSPHLLAAYAAALQTG